MSRPEGVDRLPREMRLPRAERPLRILFVYSRLPLPIPYDLTLRGFTVHTQALIDDPLVPLTRIATSAGLTLRIGD